ncbi:hypothetical protein M0R36_10490 [bacterium]|jgi:hypothetical protein|nr:hypothetical protein [bacterium]
MPGGFSFWENLQHIGNELGINGQSIQNFINNLDLGVQVNLNELEYSKGEPYRQLPDRIGFPPEDLVMSGCGVDKPPEDTRQFLLRMDLYPRLQTIDFGPHIFYSKPALSEYKNTLRSLGMEMVRNKLSLYILSEGAISDGVSSSYGPSFMGSAFNLFSSVMPVELISLSRANPAVQDFVQQLGNMSEVKGLEQHAKDILGQDLYKSVSNITKSYGGLGSLAANLAKGKRIDLPNIWQGSSSRLSYSATIRLYNINPYDYAMYKHRIVNPIIALMALCTPKSADGILYDRPYIVRVDCPGLFKIKEAAITDISVVKGGDANDISFKQHPNMVDVRISFESIYPAMIMLEQENAPYQGNPTTLQQFKDRLNADSSPNKLINEFAGPPTLNEYLENMLDDRELLAPGTNWAPGQYENYLNHQDILDLESGGDRVPGSQKDIFDNLKNRGG